MASLEYEFPDRSMSKDEIEDNLYAEQVIRRSHRFSDGYRKELHFYVGALSVWRGIELISPVKVELYLERLDGAGDKVYRGQLDDLSADPHPQAFDSDDGVGESCLDCLNKMLKEKVQKKTKGRKLPRRISLSYRDQQF